MAQSMDEEMYDATCPLQEDLTCPVCKGIFQDPVLLPCTHSFCRQCLEKSLQLNRTCPVCRKPCDGSQPIANRALSDACESFLKENRRPQYRPVPADHCNLHHRELQLYCVKDEEPVCVDCVPQHCSHQLLPIERGVPLCQDELLVKAQILEKKVDLYKKMKQKFNNTVQYIKHQAGQAEKQIKAEFERLRQALITEESLRLRALAVEEEHKISVMENLIAMTAHDITSLTEMVDSLKKEMSKEDVNFLRNFQNLKRGARWTSEDPELPADSLLNLGKHVGSLSFNIWKSMQQHVKHNPVVLNPNTASPWLSLNADLTSMKESTERQMLPDNPERFDPCVFVLGTEGFTTGKHRWDIIVGDNPKWMVGVCRESVSRKKKFTVSTERGVWAIGLSKGVYSAMTPKRTVLAVEQRPERIRVKLNMDKGEVSFWDGETAKHLCTLTNKFSERIYPLFGPGLSSTPMVLCPAKVAVHTS